MKKKLLKIQWNLGYLALSGLAAMGINASDMAQTRVFLSSSVNDISFHIIFSAIRLRKYE